MSRLQPTPNTVKKLFALSGNRCAFPGCSFSLLDKDGNLVGQICHIEAAEEGGERYNPGQTDEQRRSFENLILLCANHHIVTNDIEKYTVDKLKNMKNNHESQFVEKPHEISDELVDKILAKSSNNFYATPINVGNGQQINQFGVSYSEVKDLFLVLFENNFPKLQKIAEKTAHNCIKSFRERFFYFASEYLNGNDLGAFK